MKTFKEVCGKRSRKEDVKSVDRKVVKSEKVVGYRTDKKLPNLKVPINRKQGKIINPKNEDVNEVKQPPKKEVMKVIGHTKNAVQGRAALRKKYGVSDKEADDIIYKAMTEEATFKVNIEGLPMMFISGMGTGDVKAKLRKIVKQPSMIKDVERVTDAEVKKNFRLKAQGRDEEENSND